MVASGDAVIDNINAQLNHLEQSRTIHYQNWDRANWRRSSVDLGEAKDISPQAAPSSPTLGWSRANWRRSSVDLGPRVIDFADSTPAIPASDAISEITRALDALEQTRPALKTAPPEESSGMSGWGKANWRRSSVDTGKDTPQPEAPKPAEPLAGWERASWRRSSVDLGRQKEAPNLD